ncbi:hypothetical protein OZX67_03885 [Bifidobacterium sp. ESL0728]|uniref:hypothetical protein n=1 Tax=Bifidobacterium sp. ESL0728 TaxID=2983220 RepID=UPI0023F9BF3E|nr:hypothetical protein [Bifidobacterium sp. ESL0728]WEV59688.1 hypothetical protein OZX67_03885 [Bifidobacterium sp. ESL0728]
MAEANDRKQQLEKDLRSLAANLPALRDIAAKKASVVARQLGHGSYTAAPIPLNLGAWQLLQDIKKFARQLAKVLGFALSFDAEFILKGSLQHLDDLLARHDAGSICKIAREACKRLDRQLEPPEDKVLIGYCTEPTCGSELWCNDQDIESGWTVCPSCGKTLNVREIQQIRMLALASAGTQGTAAELSKLLASCGLRVRRKTISEWKRRGIVHQAGQQNNKPVYLLWDIWRAMNRKTSSIGSDI